MKPPLFLNGRKTPRSRRRRERQARRACIQGRRERQAYTAHAADRHARQTRTADTQGAASAQGRQKKIQTAGAQGNRGKQLRAAEKISATRFLLWFYASYCSTPARRCQCRLRFPLSFSVLSPRRANSGTKRRGKATRKKKRAKRHGEAAYLRERVRAKRRGKTTEQNDGAKRRAKKILKNFPIPPTICVSRLL